MTTYEFNAEDYAILMKIHRPQNFVTRSVKRTTLPAGKIYTTVEYLAHKEQMDLLKEMNT